MQNDFFFQEELRDNFRVSTKRKKIWAVQLELLEQISQICKLHHLRYFATNGTLLGAMKYGGFVPWDDDLDIMMPRCDYEKFIEIANKTLKHPFYFQDGSSEDIYFRMYGRIRNEKTTCVGELDLDQSKRSGIFIDIFPIDGVNTKMLKWQMLRINLLYAAITELTYPNFVSNGPQKILKIIITGVYRLFFSLEKMKKRLENIQKKYTIDSYNMGFIITHKKPVFIKNEWLDNVKYVKFEWTSVPTISGSDEFLQTRYGDYMNTVPSDEEKRNHHILFVDPDNPYSKYYGKLKKDMFTSEINNY